MKKWFINSCIKLITKYKKYSKEDLEKLRYGLEGLYLTITKLIVIVLLSILLHIFIEVVITLILFNIIRYFGFGFHAKESWQCLLISIFNFIIIPLFFINIKVNLYIYLIICSLSILLYILYAPMDTVKRPLPNKKKRIIRKSLTVTVGIIYGVLVFLVPYLRPMLLSALVIQDLVVNPLTYIIFGQPYNNYKTYVA